MSDHQYLILLYDRHDKELAWAEADSGDGAICAVQTLWDDEDDVAFTQGSRRGRYARVYLGGVLLATHYERPSQVAS